jgi:putative ABC transport system ATP-binding protein
VIEVRHLDFRYPQSDFRLCVDAMDLASGEAVALVGPSGAGKSTLLHLLAGILVPSRGTIRLCGDDVTRLSDADRRRFRVRQIGFVFQSFELIEYLNTLENVLLPRLINPANPPTAETRERAAELLGEVGLGGKESRSVLRLSHGEQQRVAIARAMLNRPRYLFADEPTGNLDPANKTLVVDLLHRQCAQTGATLVMVTHDREVLNGFARVIDFPALLREEAEEPA